MSDEYAKTVVLDDLPFTKMPGKPTVSNDTTADKPAGSAGQSDSNPGLNYPGFEDTSWLT